jgi:hypothetical protein
MMVQSVKVNPNFTLLLLLQHFRCKWSVGNVYLSVVSRWKVNIVENPFAVIWVVDTFGQRLFLCSNHTAVFLTYSRALSQVGTYKSSHASCQNAYHPGGNGLLSPLFVKSQCHHQSAMHWCLLPFHRKTRWTRISWPHLSSLVKRQFSHGTKSWKSNVIYRSNVEASW